MQFGPYSVELKNRDKLFFPGQNITKGDLIDYYDKIADHLLPYLEGRPLTFSRFPDGIEGEGFYQKECPDYFPDWIEVVEVKKKEGGTIRQVLCNNKATLIYLVNQGTLSFHPWLSDTTDLYKPNKLVFDLDSPDGNFDVVIKGARTLRSLLEKELGLSAFVMTTGSQGLHVASPIKATKDFDEALYFAKKIAGYIAESDPDNFTHEMRKERRRGRLFFDYVRNAYGQTAIPPYSVRALEGAPVATPVGWDELSQSGLTSQSYHVNNIFRRLSQLKKDPWEQFHNKAIDLEGSIEKLNTLKRE